jgi:hypothetical protein
MQEQPWTRSKGSVPQLERKRGKKLIHMSVTNKAHVLTITEQQYTEEYCCDLLWDCDSTSLRFISHMAVYLHGRGSSQSMTTKITPHAMQRTNETNRTMSPGDLSSLLAQRWFTLRSTTATVSQHGVHCTHPSASCLIGYRIVPEKKAWTMMWCRSISMFRFYKSGLFLSLEFCQARMLKNRNECMHGDLIVLSNQWNIALSFMAGN